MLYFTVEYQFYHKTNIQFHQCNKNFNCLIFVLFMKSKNYLTDNYIKRTIIYILNKLIY